MIEKIFNIKSDVEFVQLTLDTFDFQYHHNPVYKEYVNLLGVQVDEIKSLEQIPFLPISFFKTHPVYCGSGDPEITFLSSGTTGSEPSRHPVASLNVYEQSFNNGFTLFFGDPKDYCFLCLLPSYLERQGSSLVYMADQMIRTSQYRESGFYLNNLQALADQLQVNIEKRIPTILLGVSYALLDLAEQHPADLNPIMVMETGGMKGRRKEQTKKELHDILKEAFQLKSIHSEYGMTELMSQAYAERKGLFQSPPWMKIVVRDPYDPMNYRQAGKPGGINIIDLANRYSCSFIQTDDRGKTNPDGSFEVLGRLEASDIRGCNLLV